MKILIYFSGKLFEPKGTPIRTRNVVRQFLANKAEVYYAGYDEPEGVGKDHVLRLAPPLLRAFQLVSYVRVNGIQAVYFQTSAGVWFAPAVRLFTSARVGVDFHSRRYQEEHIYRNRSRLHTAFLEAVELFLCRFVSFGTAVSATISAYYAPTGIRMLTLPVGVDTRIFRPDVPPRADIVSWKADSTLLAYAGNTKWYQGVEGVLDAFLKMQTRKRDAYKLLVIASSGADDVRAFAEKHHLEDAMRILDKQPHESIPSLLAAADVLTVVRPSDMVTEYSFPSKLPEYAALGKALIVSRVSDIASYIQDGVNGLIVPPSDNDALSSALDTLSDPELRRRLGREARRLAEREFELDILGRALYDFVNAHIA